LMEQPQTSKVTYNIEVLMSPDLAVAKLIAGETDFAGLPTNTAAILYNKGVGVQLAAIIGWGVMYVVSDDPKIKSWGCLKGKEIYVPNKGALPDILLRYLLVKNGLTEQDVKIQYFNSAVEIAQLLAAGKAGLAALPEPWVTQVVEKNPKMKVVLDFQKEWKRIEKQGLFYPQTCIAVRRQFAKEHPESVREFLKDLNASMKWLQANKKAGAILAEKYVQISAAAVMSGLGRCNLKYNDACKVRKEINGFLSRLAEYAPESVGGKVPDEDFIYQP
ncbi:MAG: ABC transporter substrate-binding protein, partial [Bacillota bacterium]